MKNHPKLIEIEDPETGEIEVSPQQSCEESSICKVARITCNFTRPSARSKVRGPRSSLPCARNASSSR